MVIGKVPLDRLIKILRGPEEILGRDINPSLFERREIEKRLQDQEPFISRVMREPKIMLIGDEDGLRKLAEEGSDKVV